MSIPHPFNVFCATLAAYGASSSRRMRLDVPIADLADWSAGVRTPNDDDLVRLHFSVTEAADMTEDIRRQWAAVLAVPVTVAMRLPRLLQIEGQPDPNDPRITVADVIESALIDQLIASLQPIRRDHRLRFLRRSVDHAAILSHYHKAE